MTINKNMTYDYNMSCNNLITIPRIQIYLALELSLNTSLFPHPCDVDRMFLQLIMNLRAEHYSLVASIVLVIYAA